MSRVPSLLRSLGKDGPFQFKLFGDYVFRAGCLFGGGGGGALGTKWAAQAFRGHQARFALAGSYDFNAFACSVYERLTGSPQAQVDARTATPGDIYRLFDGKVPDFVFCSAPCKGASKLLSSAKAKTKKYAAMNTLSYLGIKTLLDAFPGDEPAFMLFENVPHITSRAPEMIKALLRLFRSRGLKVHSGFHEARHLGDLAQRRKRWLMIVRNPRKVPVLCYQPPHKAGKVCGDVLSELPLPNDPAGGPMHRLSDTSVLNLLRLWAIPAGGDWRDLLKDGRPKREKFRRHLVQRFDEPSATIGGSGSNGPCAIADERVELARDGVFHHVDRVTPWLGVFGTVTAGVSPSNGAPSAADPRLPVGLTLARSHGGFTSLDHVLRWDGPSRTITTARRPGSGAPSIAAPLPLDLLGGRAPTPEDLESWHRDGTKPEGVRAWFGGKYAVNGWDKPTRTVIGGEANGASFVADPRLPRVRVDLTLPSGTFHHVNRITAWDDAFGTVTHSPAPSSGAPATADPRLHLLPVVPSASPWDLFRKYEVAAWAGTTGTVIAGADHGAYAVADPCLDLLSGVPAWHHNALGVVGAEDVAATVTGAGRPTTGRFSYADPGFFRFRDAYGVLGARDTAATVTAEAAPSTGRFAFAGPVPLQPQPGNDDLYWGKYVVVPWDGTANTVTGASRVGSGALSAADPRIDLALRESCFHEGSGLGKFGVLTALDSASTVTGNARHSTGPFSIAATVPGPGELDLSASGIWRNRYGVLSLGEVASTVTGNARLNTGAFSVAAPVPVNLVPVEACYDAGYGVLRFDMASRTIAAKAWPGTGAYAIADQVPGTDGRPIDLIPPALLGNPERRAWWGVLRFDQPARTITGTTSVGCGAYAIADRVPGSGVSLGFGCTPRNGAYGVTPFDRPAFTIIASANIDNSPIAIADPRPAPPAYVVLSCDETQRIVDGEVPLPFAVVDPERPDDPLAIVDDLAKPPFRWVERTVVRTSKRGKVSRKTTKVKETVALVLVSSDGTWHRPLTTLELAILQSFPAKDEAGKPLDLGVPKGKKGRNADRAVTAQREVIGNAVPPKCAQAMAEQMLLSLLVSTGAVPGMGVFGTAVWVRQVRALEKQLRAEGYVVVKGNKPLNFTTGVPLDDGAFTWGAKRRRATPRTRRRAVEARRLAPVLSAEGALQ